MPVIISAKNLTKEYGKKDARVVALRGVNLEVQQGEAIALIGKSGSGKSTLMHLLALLDSPSGGEITIGGVLSSKLSGHQKDMIRNSEFGFVFQQFFLNTSDTVLNNVILPLTIAGVGFAERKKLGMQALAEVELTDKAGSKANDLSGGQKQRVVIARALINNPSVIFADEPTGNLDSVTGKKIEDMLFTLNKTKNITLIVVTHDPDLAARCDRQLHIKDGLIVDGQNLKEEVQA